MRSSEQLDKLAPALIAAQSEMRGIGKSGHNTHGNYDYAKLEDVVNASAPVLTKCGLSVVTSIVDAETLADRPTQKGGVQYAVRVKTTTRILHVSGQWVETDGFGDGQDTGDKGIYKAITGARKYALAATLNQASKDDPENDDGGADEGRSGLSEGTHTTQRKAPAPTGGADDFL